MESHRLEHPSGSVADLWEGPAVLHLGYRAEPPYSTWWRWQFSALKQPSLQQRVSMKL